MLDLIEKSPSLILLKELLAKENSFLFEGLTAPTKALLARLIVKATGKSVLLITGGVREDLLFNDLSTFNDDPPIEFPAWETLPGEEIPPSPDILGKRFEALALLTKKKTPSVVLCPLVSLLQKTISKNTLSPLLTTWKKGMQLPFDTLSKVLRTLGYTPQKVVSDKGEFAMRGGIVDLFPISASEPFRVEFFGDTIENIRSFDPVGQKSTGKVDSFFLTPADELSFLQKEEQLSSIFDFLETPWIFWDDLVAIEESLVALKNMPGARGPFFTPFEDAIKRFDSHVFCTSQSIEELSANTKPGAREKHFQNISFDVFDHTFEAKRFFHPFVKLEDVTQETKETSLTFINQNKTQEDEVKKQIGQLQNVSFERGSLSSSFSVSDLQASFIANSTMSGKVPVRRQKWRSSHHTLPFEFHDLDPGSLVVHYHSGIGKFLGMEKQKNHLGAETEFLMIEYSGGSKLFVPLSQSYLVSRYIGSSEEGPKLSELGTKRWQKVRDNATSQIVGYANDLLRAQAEREIKGGLKFPPDGKNLEQFEREFPYEETEDQILAIHDLKQDMMSDKPMDRLICGDVGYGKTEVAMRAAFKAVSDGGKQVAVLVPTTILAMQHFETFSQRMNQFPINIEVVSRFRTPKQIKITLEKLQKGEVDILIGTHRLLSKDVLFKDLGFLIVDEEQRFGVRSKEHLKKMKVGVDSLTLSATPIPRTLHMSLVSARDMSVINTPPQDRLPIKTIIAEHENELVQNALLREFARGGQAFYIHNRVETIYGRAEEIQKLVPRARVGVVHGQLHADDIDTVFHKFKHGEIDLLFATTIIESGIDIPNANTMLIDRADTYGLADLYQLRGRVGRWNRAAYTYFLIPKHVRLTEIARKRLNALVEGSGFGGGMKVAMRDLEIRGAGDILGSQQSGQVSSIGFHLYCKFLKRAIESLKRKKPVSFFETKMEFPFDARFPEDYINDVSLRMELYYRLGEAAALQDVDDLLDEIKDRFGEAPRPVLWMYHLARIRVFAAEHRFTLLKFGKHTLSIQKRVGKEEKSHTLPLPKDIQSPEKLEVTVIEILKTITG